MDRPHPETAASLGRLSAARTRWNHQMREGMAKVFDWHWCEATTDAG